ncbi:hypothetical protein TSAR_013000 [Trichomalopsis sarcophagae]|uniref:Uncharacterized protein n=1 Tax=Trichomalopsis sarcophagae TaxID=543379 RepID=A0A232F8H2_9HYME|nr:hypothetical protein TSAR_013000 [Trichomalopsis sarcophagae]
MSSLSAQNRKVFQSIKSHHTPDNILLCYCF